QRVVHPHRPGRHGVRTSIRTSGAEPVVARLFEALDHPAPVDHALVTRGDPVPVGHHGATALGSDRRALTSTRDLLHTPEHTCRYMTSRVMNSRVESNPTPCALTACCQSSSACKRADG